MAVQRVGVGYTRDYVLGGDEDGSRDFTLNVPASAENTYGILAYGWVGDTDISTDSDFTATWAGGEMVPLCDPIHFDEHTGHYHSFLRGWIIENPAAGTPEIEGFYADATAGLITKNLFLAAGVFANVEPLDMDNIGDSVVTAAGTTSVGTSGVTVPSDVPADRVISAHLVGKLRSITGFTGTRVAAPLLWGGGQLVLGETRGAPSTVATVTHNASTADWAAFGLALPAAPLSGLGFSGAASVDTGSFGANVYRHAEPHPDREFIVPPLGADRPDVRAGSVVLREGGMWMPVWVKDVHDTLDYTIHWGNLLAPDDEIVSVQHITQGALQIFSESYDGDTTQVWVNGAVYGQQYPVLVRWSTKLGRQHDCTFLLVGGQN